MNVLFIVLTMWGVQVSNDVYVQVASKDAIVIYNHDAMIIESVYIMTQQKNSNQTLEEKTSKKQNGITKSDKELPAT